MEPIIFRPPANAHRRLLRLPGYDYSRRGAYFITICSQERRCIFGEVSGGQVHLSSLGRLVEQCWLAIPSHFNQVTTDALVVMPNHVHGVLLFAEGPTRPLAREIRAFKAAVSQRAGFPVWQRNYYEHIVRSEESLNKIRRYIDDNPLNWHCDTENLARPRRCEVDSGT